MENEYAAKNYVISIHTPAKGVTLKFPFLIFSTEISIHTPAKGVTIIPISFWDDGKPFQSTLPRRE